MSGARYSFTTDDGHMFSGFDGVMHSFDDQPAVVYADGTKWWYVANKISRDGGPAVVWSNGVEEWWLDNMRHRDGGPAVTYPDNDQVMPQMRGVRQWWTMGKPVREDVPEPARRARGQ